MNRRRERGERPTKVCLLAIGIVSLALPLALAESRRVLCVIPFVFEKVGKTGVPVTCPICGGVSRGSPIPAGSGEILTGLLYDKIGKLGRFSLTQHEKIKDALFGMGMETYQENFLSAAMGVCRSLGADYVLIGKLFRFEQRIGSSWGVEKPASVSFHLHLIRTKDKKIVWTGRFDETQRPLSEDILKIRSFLRRKASWLSAEELASVGMDELLETLADEAEMGTGR